MAGVCGGSGFNKGLSMLPSASIAMSHISRLSGSRSLWVSGSGGEWVLGRLGLAGGTGGGLVGPSGRQSRGGGPLLSLHLFTELLLQLLLPELPLERGFALCGTGGQASGAALLVPLRHSMGAS